MSEEKNIINYTATDIEKYWNGKLSPAEMHSIEKAAMDDPFLADALEGYKNASLADLDSLKERLDKRIGAGGKITGSNGKLSKIDVIARVSGLHS